MSKNGLKIYGALTASVLFAGGIAWISSAPWWVIIIATIGAPVFLVFLFFIVAANKIGNNI